jgi:hypothetical protein
MTFVSNASTTARPVGDRAIHVLQAYGSDAGRRREPSCEELINAQRACAFGNRAGLGRVLGNVERRLLNESEPITERQAANCREDLVESAHHDKHSADQRADAQTECG